MRTLYIMRHAQAGHGSPDKVRDLTELGRSQAADAGARFALAGPVDLAIVSGAVRTRQTFEGIVSAGGVFGDVHFDDDLYTAGQYGALELLQEVVPSVSSVLLLGHEPTVSGLTALLSNGATPLGREAGRGFWPSQVAVLEFGSTWAGLDMRGVQVNDLWKPRKY
ncbi:phosphohistidine phosphatase [Arcanobacterium wilhelmae]|uniref:Phosphohistidine phosphatase n=1 Tax=Arcanobacterium wilhelmae TaxID=1803177 RepID=A0ABT9N8C7_9ACTO|nr:histidine phosphatase family protein [Arcanobacterium wilhelmae]MDP9799948.1 phosphohistidine phosphatase [Arcanobacterium wilhelmae]WFN91082.1 histidine phosphatase family protein [Arcanobacterium wilhelmae]